MQFQLSLTNILLLILCIKIVSADRCNELCGLNCGAFTTCEVDVFVCSCKANVGEIVGLIVGIIAALIIACVSKTENKFQAFVTILLTILKITEVQLLNIILFLVVVLQVICCCFCLRQRSTVPIIIQQQPQVQYPNSPNFITVPAYTNQPLMNSTHIQHQQQPYFDNKSHLNSPNYEKNLG